MTANKLVRCRITNLRSIGKHCGYGEGRTSSEAMDDALRVARQSDPRAYILDNRVYMSVNVYL